MPAVLEDLGKYRGQVPTRSGPASYLDTGGAGRPALFVHGIGTSSYLWRHVLAELGDERRCLAVDLPLHGQTAAAGDQDFSLPGLARFLADFCAALELSDIDLVANDTGGAVAQVFAAAHSGLLHTLTLTNCDTQDNFPPRALLPVIWTARLRILAPVGRWIARDPGRARKPMFGAGYEDLTRLPEEVVRAWVEPLLGTRDRARQYQRLFRSLHARDLRAAGPGLSRLQVPTLIAWGTGDRFFPVRFARHLRDTIPGAVGLTEIDGGRLFFPDERAAELTAALRRHWDAHP
jgi:pimeloyl-ACP methyl ester carboxylesterase